MKYKCIRTCFVASRLWEEGKIYELPNNINKHPKNFQPVDKETIGTSEAPLYVSDKPKAEKPKRKSSKK